MRSTILARLALAAVLATGLSTAACASPTEGPRLEAGDDDLTARLGFTKLRAEGSQVVADVAVSSRRLYVAKGRDGVLVVDPRTMEVESTWERDADGRRLFTDGVQVVGDQVLSYAERDDSDLDIFGRGTWKRVFVVRFHDAETGRVDKEIVFDLTEMLATEDTFVQLPTMSAFFDAETQKLSVAFSHIQIQDVVVTLPLPAAAKTELDLANVPGASVTEVERPHGLFVADGKLLLAQTTKGLSIVDAATGAVTSTFPDLGHALDVVAAAGRAYVADHDGAVNVLDLASGEVVGSIPVNDWVRGVAVDGKYVYVASNEGVTVARLPR